MSDTYKLSRFIDAQAAVYAAVVQELQAGIKRGHWMWFIFPQLAGLGSSTLAQSYAINSLAEARAYLEHPLLGARLRDCTRLVLQAEARTPVQIFGPIDSLKFRSCMSLFMQAAEDDLFRQAIEKTCHGEVDPLTLGLLQKLAG